MREHHRQWLKAHPNRTVEWLNDKLADGFDVHHLDGDHSNNDPANLILIEGADHAAIHLLPPTEIRISRTQILAAKRQKRHALQDALGYRHGSFTRKEIKGKTYWYFQDSRTRKQQYVGPCTPELDSRVLKYNIGKKKNPHAHWEAVKDLVP